MTHSHSLRDPRKLKAPDRYDGDVLEISPPSVFRVRDASYEESESEHSYVAPNNTSSTPRGRKRGYRGPIVEFDPSLPPAAFPTLDNPCYAKSEATTTRGTSQRSRSNVHSQPLESHQSSYAAIDDGRMTSDHQHNARSELRSSVNSRKNVGQNGIRVQTQPSINIDSDPHNGNGGRSDNASSRENSPDSVMYRDNMRRMENIGKRTSYESTLMEMETSDEDEQSAKSSRQSASARMNESCPTWDELTVPCKLSLVDTTYEVYPHANAAQILRKLRLTSKEIAEMTLLLCQRQDRAAREKLNQARLMKKVHDYLVNTKGRYMTIGKFRSMLDDTVYTATSDEEYLEAKPSELAKARAFLETCGIDSSLMDDDWKEDEDWKKAVVSETDMEQNLAQKQSFSQPSAGAVEEVLGRPPSRAFALPSRKSHGPFKARPTTKDPLANRISPLRQTTTVDSANITKATGTSLASEPAGLSQQTAGSQQTTGPLRDTSEEGRESTIAPSRRNSDATSAELHRSLASFAQVQRRVSLSIPSPPEEPSLLSHVNNAASEGTASGRGFSVERVREANIPKLEFNARDGQHAPESAPSSPANKRKSSMNSNGHPPKTKSSTSRKATPMAFTPAPSTSPDAESQPSQNILLKRNT